MRVWTVSEIKAGTLTQCLGVARHIDPDPQTVIVDRNLPRWRAKYLSPYRRLRHPEPDIIVSCGRLAPRHVFAIAAACQKRPFTVHLQTPQPEFAQQYDLAFISRHDWTEEKARTPNFHPMIGVPHQITKERLNKLRSEVRSRWVPNGGKAIAVLVGGSNGAYEYDSETIGSLISAIRRLSSQGWAVLLSTSRRSDPHILELLLKIPDENIIVWNQEDPNPYIDFLAAADAFLVTKDSITMNCEAIASGYPVYTFDLSKKPGKRLEKFEFFHDDMSKNLNLTRPFEGKIRPYDYAPPDEANRIAGLVTDSISTFLTRKVEA